MSWFENRENTIKIYVILFKYVGKIKKKLNII